MTKNYLDREAIDPDFPPNTILEMGEIVEKIDKASIDASTLYHHIKNNTLDQYYEELLRSVINDMTLIPIEQTIHHVGVVDDAISATLGLKQIAVIIGTLFVKDPNVVEKDIFTRMQSFPVDEVRIAHLLRHEGMLN